MVKIRDEELVRDALRIVEEARKRGIVLRIIGAIAIRLHAEDLSELHRRLSRLGREGEQFTDIDMVTYRSQREAAHKMFIELGYKPDKLVMAYFGENRFLYHHPEDLYHIDLFFEKLQFSHDLDLGSKRDAGRLELDYPTLTPADLLLEKLQIHEINEKDIKDLIILLREHGLAEDDAEESINIKRAATVLSQDWGFWYDAKLNLEKVTEFSEKYHEDGLLEKGDVEEVSSKIERLLSYMDEAPKTKAWLKRANDGTKKKWWRDVEELVR
jgi:hypothetical protein